MRKKILSLFSLWAPLLALCLVTSASADESSVSCEVNAKWTWKGTYLGLALVVRNNSTAPIFVLQAGQSGFLHYLDRQRRIQLEAHLLSEERAAAIDSSLGTRCALQPLRFHRIEPGRDNVLSYSAGRVGDEYEGWPILGWVSIVEGDVYALMKGKETSEEYLATIDRVIVCMPSVVPPRPTRTKREKKPKAEDRRPMEVANNSETPACRIY